MLTRYVLRGIWPFRWVALEVADDGVSMSGGAYVAHKPWRKARPEDLVVLTMAKEREFQNRFSPKRFGKNRRVIASRSSFAQNSRGVVEFQEPLGGRVWVRRDGSSSPSWFYADELDYEVPVIALWIKRAACSHPDRVGS
jgi:hypothetical protein